jgi:hypothetical protein
VTAIIEYHINTSMFDSAFYPHIKHTPYLVSCNNDIISRHRCAQSIARHLWSEIDSHLTYDNQANVIYAMSDIVRYYDNQHPAKQALVMIVNAYNDAHNFRPNSEQYISIDDLKIQ